MGLSLTGTDSIAISVYLRPRTSGFKLEETRDFMPEFGPTAGYAVTVAIKPHGPAPDPDTWATSNARRSSARRAQ